MPHSNRGRGLETLLGWQHARYAAAGRATVFKTPPSMTITRTLDRGQFVCVFTGKGPPDYAGVALGIAVCFEAKETRATRWPLKDLQPHQASAFDEFQRAGGRAFIVLSHLVSGSHWFLDWSSVGGYWAAWNASRLSGKRAAPRSASLGLSDLREIGVKIDGVDWLAGGVDWLAVL